MPRELASLVAREGVHASDWRKALFGLVSVWAALFLISAREWQEMLHQWWNIDTYGHILVVPFILLWLVVLRRRELERLEPRAWGGGLIALLGMLLLWLTGRLSGINLIAQFGAVGALVASVIALMGPRVALVLAVPLGFAFFLVPFGDEIIPPLQWITAQIAVALTHASGVEAHIEGYRILTPAGLFIVAEACSGVKFLIAMFALGTLVCATLFRSWLRRAVFMLACLVVPILANGVRAWGTIFLAQTYGVEFAAGFDHIVYGWIFFAIVIAILIGAAQPFVERDPHQAGFSASGAEQWLADRGFSPSAGDLWRVVFVQIAVATIFGALAIYAESLSG